MTAPAQKIHPHLRWDKRGVSESKAAAWLAPDRPSDFVLIIIHSVSKQFLAFPLMAPGQAHHLDALLYFF